MQPAASYQRASSRKRPNEGATYNPAPMSPVQHRLKRRKYLQQKRLAAAGCLCGGGLSLTCGRFSQEYIDALKGQDYLSSNTACRWYFNPKIPEAESFYASLQAQRIEIRHAPASVQQPQQLPAIATEYKTLQEMQAINPYKFPEPGYRCIVTIARLVPGAYWFASCSRCSKSCTQEAGTYKCKECSSTVFRFKYKLCFVASDGTVEAEMMCFGDIGRRIVEKPVQQVMRSARGPSDEFPTDICAIVSLKFAFSVILTRESYYKPVNSYQVTSIVTPYGRQRVIPHVTLAGGASSSTQKTSHLPIGDTIEPGVSELDASGGTTMSKEKVSGHDIDVATTHAGLVPSATTEDHAMHVPSLHSTPPTTLQSTGTSVTKRDTKSTIGKGDCTPARRKLLLASDIDENTAKERVKKPRSRRSAGGTLDHDQDALADESGHILETTTVSDGSDGADSPPIRRSD